MTQTFAVTANIEANSVIWIAVFVAILFISIAFHETMHALVAYRLGDDLAHSHGRISLNPLHHIDPVLTIALPAILLFLGLPLILAAKPVPINPNRVSGEELGLAAIGIAGPLTNLFLATIVAVVLRSDIVSQGFLNDVLLLFVELNVGLFVFNMLPIPPLDGSRVLYAVAPRGVQDLMDRLEGMGFGVMLLILFMLLQVLGPIISTANSFFLDILLR